MLSLRDVAAPLRAVVSRLIIRAPSCTPVAVRFRFCHERFDVIYRTECRRPDMRFAAPACCLRQLRLPPPRVPRLQPPCFLYRRRYRECACPRRRYCQRAITSLRRVLTPRLARPRPPPPNITSSRRRQRNIIGCRARAAGTSRAVYRQRTAARMRRDIGKRR